MIQGLTEARNKNLSLTHGGGIKAPIGLLWSLQKVNSQENEQYLLLKDLTPGFGLFTPKSTEAGGGLRMSCDSKSFGRSSLLHFIGSWKQSWRVLLGHHGHWWSQQILSGFLCCAWDSSYRTKRSRHCFGWMCRMQSGHERCLRWEAWALLWRPSMLFLTLWSLSLGSQWAFTEIMFRSLFCN